MNKKIILLISVCVLAFALQAQQKVAVAINYGGMKPNATYEVLWEENMTALMALQHCAEVLTHPVGDYIFVTAINDVKATVGVKAWYYRINGESANVLAFRYFVKPGEQITWIYKKDECSGKVQKPR
jgi:hypothetical protein